MPTSLSKAFVVGVSCDNVALVSFLKDFLQTWTQQPFAQDLQED
jgi:hypothetical protein